MKIITLRYTTLAAVLGLALTGSPVTPTHASGFPVIDVASLGQSLQDFVTQNSQLAEQIAQYQQMLTDYQLMIENLSGYADVDALKAVLTDTVNTRFSQTLTDLMDLVPDNPLFEEQISILYEENWGSPPDFTDITSDYSTVFDAEDLDSIQGDYDKDREKHERYLDTFEAVARNRERAETRAGNINDYSSLAGGLGPNEEMRALQLTALQMNLMLQQMEASIAAQDQMLTRMEEEQREALEARLDERKRELDRVKRQSTETHNDHDFSSWTL